MDCIGCPLAGSKQMMKEFADYPKYKENYIKAFDRMIGRRRRNGKPNIAENGADLFKLWIGENPKQCCVEDFIEQGADQ